MTTKLSNRSTAKFGPFRYQSPGSVGRPSRSLVGYKPSTVRQLARSVEATGVVLPIGVNERNEVAVGLSWLLAAEKAGIAEIATFQIDGVTPETLDALQIIEKRFAEVGTFNEPELAQYLKEVSNLADFNLEGLCLPEAEIDRLLAFSPKPENIADHIPSLREDIVTHAGSMWILGKHRLGCLSALDSRSYELLLDGKKAQAICCDLPYNVPIDGYATGNGSIKHREFAMASGEMTSAEFVAFLGGVISHLILHSTDGSLHYLFMDWKHTRELLEARRRYSNLKNICVWVKKNGGMGSLYRSQHELVFVYKNGSAQHRNNIELGKHGRNRTNVWNYDGMNSFGRITDEGNLLAMHPTVKPMALISDIIRDCTRRRDIVLDPCLGSGTTLLAAEQLGRVCYGMEIDPMYIDLAVRRWQRFTGDEAIDLTTGQSFDKIASKGGTNVRL